MRVLPEGDWICQNTWFTTAAKPTLKIINAVTGRVLLDITEDQAAGSALLRRGPYFTRAVLELLQISPQRQCLYDIVTTGEGDDRIVDEVQFGKVYSLIQRPCARCTMCDACCTREGPHRLCSHGGFDHLWCMPARLVWPQHQSEPRRITVEGYNDGLGLDTRFTRQEVIEELDNIQQQYELPIEAAYKTLRGYHNGYIGRP